MGSISKSERRSGEGLRRGGGGDLLGFQIKGAGRGDAAFWLEESQRDRLLGDDGSAVRAPPRLSAASAEVAEDTEEVAAKGGRGRDRARTSSGQKVSPD